MLKIVNLEKRKDLVNEVTSWLWKEWGTENNYIFFNNLVKYSLNVEDIPQMFVALLGDTPIGAVGLWRNDLKSRQDLYPWLGGLFVCEQYRNKGIATELQKTVIEQATRLGYSNLYLFTELNGYYEKSGWDYVEDGMTYAGEIVRIYKLILK